MLSELPTVWVQSHAEGYGIRRFACSANPSNDEKSFHNAHHNVNASISLGFLFPNEGDCDTFERAHDAAMHLCHATG